MTAQPNAHPANCRACGAPLTHTMVDLGLSPVSNAFIRPENIAQGDVDHSLAVLHGLTSSTGGMVAAATTSIPERSDAGRNYDYRYAWIRDQCYAGQAASAAGDPALLMTCADFVTARLLDSGPELKPAYTIDGGTVPDESRLQLPGYPGADLCRDQSGHQAPPENSAGHRGAF